MNLLFSAIGKEMAAGTIANVPIEYTAVPFNLEHFAAFAAEPKDTITTLFIDGGIADLVRLPHAQMNVIRICGVLSTTQGQKKKQVVRREYLVTIGKKCVVTDHHGKEMPLLQILLDQCATVHENEKIASSFRKCLEWSLAVELATQHKPDLVVLDGTLQAEHDGEKILLAQLEQLPCVVAFSKTSGLLTETGNPLGITLQRMTSQRVWWYVPVAQNAATCICMARLNELSLHCFRIDLFNAQKEQWSSALASLKAMSNDAAFPGYPYGLILVDSLARIANQEKEMLLARLQAAKEWKDLLPMLATTDAHDRLDQLQF